MVPLACGERVVSFGEAPISVASTGTPPTSEPPTRVATSGVIVCADPAQRSIRPFEIRSHTTIPPGPEAWIWGGAALVGDFDGDGDHDVGAPAEGFMGAYQNVDGSAFPNTEVFLGLDLTFGSAATVVDYDGDADFDILLARFDRPTALLRNDGVGVFVDVAAEAGIATTCPAQTTSWADYDRDGDLDLFIGCTGAAPYYASTNLEPGQPKALYANLGDGTFRDDSAMLPQAAHDAYTYAGGFHDLDRDGWADLFLVNDYGALGGNVVLVNRGGVFAQSVGMGLDVVVAGTGLGAGDINEDGIPDFLVPDWRDLRLLISKAGVWADGSEARHLTVDADRDQTTAWGAEMVDLDNDGDLDALVNYGFTSILDPDPRNTTEQPDAAYVQQADGSFIDLAPSWGIADLGTNRGLVAAELNGDGFPDVIKRDLDGPDVLYLSACDASGWLRIRLHAPGLNRHAVGAVVTVSVGDRRWTRDILAGGTSYASAGPPEAHLGLGDIDQVDVIEVRWPDGAVTTTRDVLSRQVVDITRE